MYYFKKKQLSLYGCFTHSTKKEEQTQTTAKTSFVKHPYIPGYNN